MKIQFLSELPAEWATKKPVRTYETQFLSIGFRRYDVVQKRVSAFRRSPDGSIDYEEQDFDGSVLARSYATEHARVIVYSESPRVWVEELSPHERFVFVQQPTQAV